MGKRVEVTQAERVDIARQDVERNPEEALKVFRYIYTRLPEREKRARAHLGHDGKGFKEEEQHYLCVLYERLEARDFDMYPHEKKFLCREMVKYARQKVVREDREAREREAAIKAAQERAQAEEEVKDRLDQQRAMTREEREAKRAENPMWGAALRDPTILDNLP